ncbi:diguanylate cyclase domain-containing protein [Paucibacter sp. DJ2R-2]|uniref:sensor domain-containing diguanylate cyclase n=1 Tax=Paucibacter sp. DJ2R-2 TaxID=2893558 RepID=UPI0021E4815E|nr:diguanylate cyclase [Paucibacter sp. DJ2R-2]MCV2423317.1 diguanylate cyclase [Paucibacter sp. DJ4R-1]MCV2438512.1 diguanylate cyclase [Paucibacter sp. DJ2R-2]
MMDDSRRPAPLPANSARKPGATPPAQIAKAALLRLAQAQLEPTPENYARAFAMESGVEAAAAALPERAQAVLAKLLTMGVSNAQVRLELQVCVREGRWDEALRELERLQRSEGPGAQAEAMAQTLERLVRGLERGGRQWTVARKKDGLQRVLEGNRSDGQRLLKRLDQLVSSWDSDVADASIATSEEPGGTPSQFFAEEDFPPSTLEPTEPEISGNKRDSEVLSFRAAGVGLPSPWPGIETSLHSTVQHALKSPERYADELMAELDAAHLDLQAGGPTPEKAALIETLCQRARHLLDHRQHLFGELGELCRELSASLVDLAEDDSWAKGQCEAMNDTLEQGLSGRGVRSVTEMLSGTRERQRTLREERSRARDSLKSLIHQMLAELGELGQHTDRFQNSVGRYAEVIEKADSLESLTGVVREMVEESRSVQSLVKQTQDRLTLEHDKASSLSRKVAELEGELQRLSNEVQTDQLTQIANRRGLLAAFATEQAKAERETGDNALIALALLDIDNFKKLNDTLGHGAGDVALKSLAERVSQHLRPGDLVARYGGEEFVLMLPSTPVAEAQAVLQRLQRALSASLFMHEGKDVFVTFSAGVTLYRPGETLEVALDRADVALYEAKHTGKNRACVAP